MYSDNTADPSLGDLIALIRRGLFLALAVAALAGAATFLISRSAEPSYRAQATILVAQGNPELRSFGVSLVTAPSLDLSAYRTAALSDPILLSAMARTGMTDTSQNALEGFRRGVSVRSEADRTTGLLHISATDTSAQDAAQRANAVAEALLTWDIRRASQNLRNIVSVLEEQIASLDAQIASIRGQEALAQDEQDQLTGLLAVRSQQQLQLSSARALSNSAVGLLEILQPASAPSTPVSPRPLRSAALAAILSVFLTYGLLLLRNALDTRLRGVEDLARVTELPVLAEFSKGAQKTYKLPREATTYLRTNVLSATSGAHPRTILVTSALAGEGKSSVALSLAASFAIDGYRTLLVDADLRKPVIGRVLPLNPALHHSLHKHLKHPKESQGRYAPASVPVNATATLDIVPSFEATPSPAEFLSSGFQSCLQKWQENYDVIVIDSPPVLPVADTLTIAPLCTGTVLVTDLKRTDRRRVQAAVRILQRVGSQVLGVVANNVDQGRGSMLYGYGYGDQEASFAGTGHNLKHLESARGPSVLNRVQRAQGDRDT